MDKPIPEAKLFKQLTISVEKLPASTAQAAKVSTYATQRARLLLGCYRTGDANDPETYVAAISATLARYSEEIITSVTHPVSGLPSKKTWLPTVKEVFDACEEQANRIYQAEARERRIKEQLAERERDRLPPLVADLDLPGRLAGVFVPNGHKRYAALVAWSKDVEDKWWKFGKSSDGRDGIWIPWSLWMGEQHDVGRVTTHPTEEAAAQ